MDFNYTKIKIGNWLFRHAYPFYQLTYFKFKRRNDASEIKLLGDLIEPGMIVYDIGANIGFYAKLLSALVGKKGKVFCFEPDKENYKRLRKNTRHLSNTYTFQNAVSEKGGTLRLYRSKLLNVDHRTYPVNSYHSVEEIAAVSLDELFQSEKISLPQFIKIDIQGYELSAFKGMRYILNTCSPMIVAEYWPHGFKRAGTSAQDFYKFFEELGYRFFLIETNRLTPLTFDYIVEHSNEPFEFSFNVLIKKL